MSDIDDLKQDLRVQLRHMDAEIATRMHEIRQGILGQRELDALIKRRNAAYHKLATLQSAMPAPLGSILGEVAEFGHGH